MAEHRGLGRPVDRSDAVAAAPIVGFVVLFAVLPFVVLVGGALMTLGATGLGSVIDDPLNARALTNSLEQGALSAVAAVALGYPVGVLVGRYRWRGRELVRSLLIVPFLLPSVVVAIGIADLFGPAGLAQGPLGSLGVLGHGLPAIVVANVVFNAPIVGLLTAVGVESASPEAERQIQTLGAGPLACYRAVWGPASWTGAAAGAVLTFAFSALAFAAPLLLCGPKCYTLEARVWSLSQVLLLPAAAAVVAGLMTVLLFPLAFGYHGLLQRLRTSRSGAPSPDRPFPWRSPAAIGLLAPALLLGGLELATMGTVLSASGLLSADPSRPLAILGGASTTSTLGISLPTALANTVLFAGLAAGIALVLGIAAGKAARSGSARRRAALSVVVFLPLLVSPVSLAFSLASFWRPWLGGEGQVWLLIVISQATVALPFGLQALLVGLSRIPAAAAEGLNSLGAGRWTAYLDAELPGARGALYTMGLFAFAVGLGEFTATYFLATPTFTTLPLALYHLESSRHVAQAAGLAGLLVVLSVGLFIALGWGGRRVEL